MSKNFQKTLFSCTRDGLTIRGTEYRPEGENLPIVIISHGFMDSQNGVRKYAEQFVRWGYAVYIYDFNGGCIRGRSDGKTTDMSVLTEREDLKAVISYVKNLPYVNTNRLILMGCSQGGFVSALTAAQLQKEVSKLILFYPALCIPDDARKGKMIFANFDPANIPEVISCGPMKLGRVYPESVIDMDAYEEIAGYAGPVLIVHGTADSIVNVSYAKRAWETYTSLNGNDSLKPRPSVQLHLLEGAGHGFQKQADKAAMFAVQQFLQGRTEILTIDVNLTGKKRLCKGLKSEISFTLDGIGDSPYFKGSILEGGVEKQEWSFHSHHAYITYVLEGCDYTGTNCRIDIMNVEEGNGWKSTVKTDSKELDFLNEADCSTYLEMRKKGPLVRIYAKTRI